MKIKSRLQALFFISYCIDDSYHVCYLSSWPLQHTELSPVPKHNVKLQKPHLSHTKTASLSSDGSLAHWSEFQTPSRIKTGAIFGTGDENKMLVWVGVNLIIEVIKDLFSAKEILPC